MTEWLCTNPWESNPGAKKAFPANYILWEENLCNICIAQNISLKDLIFNSKRLWSNKWMGCFKLNYLKNAEGCQWNDILNIYGVVVIRLVYDPVGFVTLNSLTQNVPNSFSPLKDSFAFSLRLYWVLTFVFNIFIDPAFEPNYRRWKREIIKPIEKNTFFKRRFSLMTPHAKNQSEKWGKNKMAKFELNI